MYICDNDFMLVICLYIIFTCDNDMLVSYMSLCPQLYHTFCAES